MIGGIGGNHTSAGGRVPSADGTVPIVGGMVTNADGNYPIPGGNHPAVGGQRGMSRRDCDVSASGPHPVDRLTCMGGRLPANVLEPAVTTRKG